MMTVVGAPRHDPIPIGEIAAPPFACPPDPHTLFARRAERLKLLAHGHELKSYLLFLSDLCTAQHAVQDGLPPVPAAEHVTHAGYGAMPRLDRLRAAADDVCKTTLDRFAAAMSTFEMPASAHAALLKVRAADAAARAEMMRSVLSNAIPVEAIAEHVFVAAALQVHFARLAALVDAAGLAPVGDGICPACGGAPAVSMVVGWKGAHGTRFCACALCGTMWHYVRIKCIACGSTKAIGYREVDGGAGIVKAETCGTCGSYVKILHQQKDQGIEPIVDDVASLDLDLLMRDTGLRRAGNNPFLIGY